MTTTKGVSRIVRETNCAARAPQANTTLGVE